MTYDFKICARKKAYLYENSHKFAHDSFGKLDISLRNDSVKTE